MKILNNILLLVLVSNICFAQIEIKSYSERISPGESVVSNDGKYLYVTTGKGIGVYAISDPSKLTKIEQINIKDGGATGLLISKDNRTLITSDGGAILVYRRNSSDGKLSLKQTLDTTYFKDLGHRVPFHLHNISLSNNDKFLFFTNEFVLTIFKLGEKGLSYHNQVKRERGHIGKVYCSPDKQHFFIENYVKSGPCSHGVYTFDEASGAFYRKSCLPYWVDIPNEYYQSLSGRTNHHITHDFEGFGKGIAFSPEGKDVYINGRSSKTEGGNVSAIVFHRWENGELVHKASYYDLYKKHKLGDVRNIYMDGNGDYLYVLSGGGNTSGIFVFQRNQMTGELTFVKGFRRDAGYGRISTALFMSFTPDNKQLYVTNFFGKNLITLENKAGRPGPQKQAVVINTNTNTNTNINNNNRPIQNNTTNTVDNTINTNTASDCEGTPLSTSDLSSIEQSIRAQATEQAKYDYALKKLQNKCLSTVQVLRIARIFEVEYMRLEFVKFAYYYTTDIDNFFLLDTLFTNSRLKDAFKKYTAG